MPKYKNITTVDITTGQYRIHAGEKISISEFLESIPAGITKVSDAPCYNPIIYSDLHSGDSGSVTVNVPAGTKAYTIRLNCTAGSVSIKFTDSAATTVLKLASGMSWERFFPSRVVDSIIITYLEAGSKVYVTMENNIVWAGKTKKKEDLMLWKRFLIIMAIVMTGCLTVYAQDAVVVPDAIPAESKNLEIVDLLKSIPGLNQGLFYNAIDSKLEYMASIELAQWKGITLEAGYSYEDAALLIASYPVLKLKDIGITLPILDLVEFNLGGAIGLNRINGSNEFVAGGTCTLIKVKW